MEPINTVSELTDLELEAVVGGKAPLQKRAGDNRQAVKSNWLSARSAVATGTPASPTGGCVGGVCRKA